MFNSHNLYSVVRSFGQIRVLFSVTAARMAVYILFYTYSIRHIFACVSMTTTSNFPYGIWYLQRTHIHTAHIQIRVDCAILLLRNIQNVRTRLCSHKKKKKLPRAGQSSKLEFTFEWHSKWRWRWYSVRMTVRIRYVRTYALATLKSMFNISENDAYDESYVANRNVVSSRNELNLMPHYVW